MNARNAGRDGGFSLVEMVIVMGLLGTTLAVVFGAVNLLTLSTSTSTEESAAAHDLSYSMELLSKTLMGSEVLYAGDYQIVVRTQTGSSAWEVSSITSTTGVDVTATRGQLIWERWSSDASGTAPAAGSHVVWVMSDRNVNQYPPKTVLFTYYTSTDATLTTAAAADWNKSAGNRVSAFIVALSGVGGYTVTGITRIRLHIASAFNAGVHDDFRDIVLRSGS